ncbi:hypothetical protein DFJ74DRAFT_658818 [Hyaloraphidium curvatum]|nr:hypothetical protein DFJ74DRAFT_658818 [Hyaloraphidium curvatum]
MNSEWGSDAFLVYGLRVSGRQLVERLPIFKKWRPKVEEIRLAARRSDENPFTRLPQEILRMIEEALWRSIAAPKRRVEPEEPGNEEEREELEHFQAYLEKKAWQSWFENAYWHRQRANETLLEFGLSALLLDREMGDSWWITLERHLRFITHVHDGVGSGIARNWDARKLPMDYLIIEPKETARIEAVVRRLGLTVYDTPSPRAQADDGESSTDMDSVPGSHSSFRSIIEGVSILHNAEPCWILAQSIYEASY